MQIPRAALLKRKPFPKKQTLRCPWRQLPKGIKRSLLCQIGEKEAPQDSVEGEIASEEDVFLFECLIHTA